jgi:hypothetical protein
MAERNHVATPEEASAEDRVEPQTAAGPPDADLPRVEPARALSPRAALERQNALLKQAIAVYDRLTAMVLQGIDVGGITSGFAELIGREVTVLDPGLQTRAAAGPGEADHETSAQYAGLLARGWLPGVSGSGQVLATLAEERRPLRLPAMPDWGIEGSCVIAPISVAETILGYLIIAEREEAGDELDLLTVQHAATVYALAMMHERTSVEVAGRFKHDIVEGLLLGLFKDELEAREHASRVGYDPTRRYRLLALVPEPLAGGTGEASEDSPAALAMRRRVLDSAVDLAERHARQAVAVARLRETVVLVPEPDRENPGRLESPAELARTLPRFLKHLFPNVVVTAVISGVAASPAALPRVYAQTRRALEVGLRFGRRGQVIAYDELGIYRLLFRVADSDDLRSFAEETLGALVAYDRKHRADFVRTLATYLERHGSPQQAARDLSVHVNTVSYRLQRIETITGLRLEQSDDRLVAQIALKILDGLGLEGVAPPTA